MTKYSNHPDADSTPSDFGPPERLHAKNKPMTKEEEAEYYDKLEEMRNDTISYYE